jgi:hypothetical protein
LLKADGKSSGKKSEAGELSSGTTSFGVGAMTDQHRTDAAGRMRSGKRSVDQALSDVRKGLSGLKFGQIVLMVNGGVVSQIERIERVRIMPVARERQ